MKTHSCNTITSHSKLHVEQTFWNKFKYITLITCTSTIIKSVPVHYSGCYDLQYHPGLSLWTQRKPSERGWPVSWVGWSWWGAPWHSPQWTAKSGPRSTAIQNSSFMLQLNWVCNISVSTWSKVQKQIKFYFNFKNIWQWYIYLLINNN